MLKQKSFAIIGGDLRMITLAELLYNDGYRVVTYGQTTTQSIHSYDIAELDQAILGADIVILPIPVLDKAGNIFAPYAKEPISFSAILNRMNRKQTLFAGNMPEAAKQLSEIHGIRTLDYFKCEELTIKNALLTAEGAIQTVLNNYAKALCDSNICVIGFGRIGKFLAKILSGFGVKITIAGRRPETEALAASYGYAYTDTNFPLADPAKYDMLINTAPSPVITENLMSSLCKDVLIIDLASGEGGTDFAAAEALGIKAIHALSLPGKTAPTAAGEAIKQTIIRLCNLMEV